MLIIQRSPGEKVIIEIPPSNSHRTIEFEVRGNASLGFKAPKEIRILRAELAPRPQEPNLAPEPNRKDLES